MRKRRWGEGRSVEVASSGPIVEEDAEIPSTTGGCAFAERCPHVMPRCRQQRPPLVQTDAGRAAACYLYEDAAVLSEEQVAGLSYGGR